MEVSCMTNSRGTEFVKTVKNYDKWKTFLRDVLLYGYRSRCDYESLGINKSTYDDLKKKLEICLEESVFDLTSKSGKLKFLKFNADSYQHSYNFLADTFGTKSITSNFYYEILILQILASEPTPLSRNNIIDILANTINEDYNDSTINRAFNALEKYGFVSINKDKKYGKLYTLSSPILDYLTPDELETLYIASNFYKNISFMTLPGYFFAMTIEDYLFNKFGINLINRNIFQYRFNNFLRILDEPVITEIQKAIKDNKILSFDYKSGRQYSVIPNRITTQYPYNKQYLIADSGEKYLINRINNIKIKAKPIAASSKSSNQQTNQCLEIIFTFLPTDNEAEVTLIKNRIISETNWMTEISKTNTQWIFRAEVQDALAYVPWLRTFHKYLSCTKNTHHKVLERLLSDKQEALANYGDIL